MNDRLIIAKEVLTVLIEINSRGHAKKKTDVLCREALSIADTLLWYARPPKPLPQEDKKPVYLQPITYN